MIQIANSTVKLSKRDKSGKQYLWILITTYYLLSKNWDIFATRRRISLIINTDYFRGGQMRPIGIDITKQSGRSENGVSFLTYFRFPSSHTL